MISHPVSATLVRVLIGTLQAVAETHWMALLSRRKGHGGLWICGLGGYGVVSG